MRGALQTMVTVAALSVVCLSLQAAPAHADHEPESSLDSFSAIGLEPRIEGKGRYIGRHPSSHYALDVHVDNDGGLDALRAQVDEFMHSMAALVWDLTRLLTLGVITLFTWAFDLDLMGDGGLTSVASASDDLYAVLGGEWLILAIVLAGLWGIWRGLIQQRYAETAGALALSVIFCVAALFIVMRPEQTIGTVSRATNELSNTFLRLAAPGGPGRGAGGAGQARLTLADRLFESFVHRPWLVLNFGGVEHCVDGRDQPVRSCRRPIDHETYAERWLEHPPGSDARELEYQALDCGRVPPCDSAAGGVVAGVAGALGIGDQPPAPAPGQFAGRVISAADEPAVDIQQRGAGSERLVLSLFVFAGNLGAVVLLGALALGIFLAQVLVLLLIAFAPLALVVGVFPGRGHDLFRTWARRLIEALLRKAIYSLVIAVVLAVLSALIVTTDALPWGLAFAFQSAFLWMVFLGRNQISEGLTGVSAEGSGHLRDAFYTKQMLRGPLRAHESLGRGASAAVGGAAGGAAGLGIGQWQAHKEKRREEHDQQRALHQSQREHAQEALSAHFQAERDAVDEGGARLERKSALEAVEASGGLSPQERHELAALSAPGAVPDDGDAFAERRRRVTEAQRRIAETGKPYTQEQLETEVARRASADELAARPPVSVPGSAADVPAGASNGSPASIGVIQPRARSSARAALEADRLRAARQAPKPARKAPTEPPSRRGRLRSAFRWRGGS